MLRIRTKEAESSFQHAGGLKEECNCVQRKGGASAESQSQRDLRGSSCPSTPSTGPQQSLTWLPQIPLDRMFQVSPPLVSPRAQQAHRLACPPLPQHKSAGSSGFKTLKPQLTIKNTSYNTIHYPRAYIYTGTTYPYMQCVLMFPITSLLIFLNACCDSPY